MSSLTLSPLLPSHSPFSLHPPTPLPPTGSEDRILAVTSRFSMKEMEEEEEEEERRGRRGREGWKKREREREGWRENKMMMMMEEEEK